MADESKSPERFSLSRWSRRKLEAARADPSAPAAAPSAPAVPASAPPASGAPAIASAAAPAAAPVEGDRPQVDALTFESDFGAFLKPEVDQATQRAALKKLFSDPRFNVMDGLDTYIDDYTQADPMPAGMLNKLGNVYALLKGDAPASDAQSAEMEGDPASASSTAPSAIEAPKPTDEVQSPSLPAAAAEPERRSPE